MLQAQAKDPQPLLTEQDVVKTVYDHSVVLTGDDLTDDDLHQFFPAQRRHEESLDGKLLSFFYGNDTHVVLKAKEGQVERPQGGF